MDNFTVQSGAYIVEGGDPIDSETGSQIIMTLVPNVGFAIEAPNFAPKSPLPQGITQITFTQDGVNVIMTMDVDANFDMPNNDLTIPICINGSSRQIGVIIKGDVDINTDANITPAKIFKPFQAEGPINTTEEVVTETLQADTGYYFANEPTISLVEGDPDSYSFSVVPSYTLDNDGIQRLTSAVCKAFYTYPDTSIEGDQILVFGRAIEIPVLDREITAYSMTQGIISVNGETRPISLVGVVGAQFTVTVVGDAGSNPNFSGTGTNTWTGTMQGSIESESIIFPGVTQDVNYTITISGPDLASDIGTNPFTLQQVNNVNFSIELLSSDYTVTPTTRTIQVLPGQTDISPPNGQRFVFHYVVTAGAVTPTFGFQGIIATPSDFTLFGGNDTGFSIDLISGFPNFAGTELNVSVVGSIFNTEFSPTGTAANFGAEMNIDNKIVDAAPPRAKTSARVFAYANSTVLCGQTTIVNDGFIFFDNNPNGSIPANGTQLYDSATSSGWSLGAGAIAIFPFTSPGGTGGQDYILVNGTGEVTASGQCSATSGPNTGGSNVSSGNSSGGTTDDNGETIGGDEGQITQE
jgi:hypothetical protein